MSEGKISFLGEELHVGLDPWTDPQPEFYLWFPPKRLQKPANPPLRSELNSKHEQEQQCADVRRFMELSSLVNAIEQLKLELPEEHRPHSQGIKLNIQPQPPHPMTTNQGGSFQNINATNAVNASPKSAGLNIALVQTGL